MTDPLSDNVFDQSAATNPKVGVSDAKATRARELHQRAIEADNLAAHLRAERDQLILRLRIEDPKRWSYSALASALGCSRELIALIVRRNAD